MNNETFASLDADILRMLLIMFKARQGLESNIDDLVLDLLLDLNSTEEIIYISSILANGVRKLIEAVPETFETFKIALEDFYES